MEEQVVSRTCNELVENAYARLFKAGNEFVKAKNQQTNAHKYETTLRMPANCKMLTSRIETY